MEDFLEIEKEIEISNNIFNQLMNIYSLAIQELKAKIELLIEKPMYNIITRIKNPESIIKKLNKKGCKITYKDMIENINDIAGIRIICMSKKDIFYIKNLIAQLPDINVIKEKDYVTNPKPSGYSSYHLIVKVPVTLLNNTLYVKVEIQIRTREMDYWANLQHEINYKPKL